MITKDVWKRNIIMKFFLLMLLTPFTGFIAICIFISVVNDYDPLWFINEAIYLGFQRYSFIFIFFLIIAFILDTAMSPTRFKITDKGICVKFLGRKDNGLIPWDDIVTLSKDSIIRTIFITRRSTNLKVSISLNEGEFAFIKRKVHFMPV